MTRQEFNDEFKKKIRDLDYAIMTPKEFEEEIVRIMERYPNDPEATHAECDDLMCKVLKQLGYSAGVELFEDSERWYA